MTMVALLFCMSINAQAQAVIGTAGDPAMEAQQAKAMQKAAKEQDKALKAQAKADKEAAKAAKEAGLRLDIEAPNEKYPSMTGALQHYLFEIQD